VRYDNSPFGEETTEPTNDPFRFAGKELDAETRLHYFAARYYRNTWGRFTSVDPLHVGAAMIDPQQWNRYAYARNNPLAYVDPSGLRACRWEDGQMRCGTYDYCTNGAIDPPFCTLTPVVLSMRRGRGGRESPDDLILDFPSTGKRGGPGQNTGQACGRPGGCPTPIPDGGWQAPSVPKLEIPLGDWIQTGALGASFINPVAGMALGAMSAAFWDDWLDSLAAMAPPGRAAGAVYKTTKAAAEAAAKLGFRKVNERMFGEAVFTDGKRYITRDVFGHNGGAWKMADSIEALGSRATRAGTYDEFLRRIGR
jgi:RHS repeat-associated protein